MEIDKLTLGEIKEISRYAGGGDASGVRDPRGALRIVILQRGWVVVGNVYLDGGEFRIENTKVIRVWGTSKGLGEIALGGPTKDTKLDECGTVRSHVLGVVAQLDCNECKWK